MIKDLNEEQKQLANFMSELSEEAFSAGWMKNLEYNLWRIMKREQSVYGRLKVTNEMIEKLNFLSKNVKGWIYFDVDESEKYISYIEWDAKLKTTSNPVGGPAPK